MLDTSNYTIDTKVLIKIDDKSVWIPELSTYTPVECYAPISMIMAFLNRGLEVHFPKQSPKFREISTKIESLLLEYREKAEKAAEKNYVTTSDVTTAIETIQDINDSHRTKEEIQEEENSHIFKYDDVSDRIVNDLTTQQFDDIIHRDFFAENAETTDKLKSAEEKRKIKEAMDARKREALHATKAETELLRKLSQDLAWEEHEINEFDAVAKDVVPELSRFTKLKRK